MCVSRCICSEVDCPFVRCYEVEFEEHLLVLVQRSMGSRYWKLVLRFSSYVVRLVTCISPNALIIECLTAIELHLHRHACGILLAVVASKCLPSHCCIGRVITTGLMVEAKSWRVSFAFHFDASGFCISLWLHLNIVPIRIWLGSLRRRSLWYAYLSRFSGRPVRAPVLQLLIIVAN